MGRTKINGQLDYYVRVEAGLKIYKFYEHIKGVYGVQCNENEIWTFDIE